MKYDPEKHHRHSIRLKGYDYSYAGAYFITICTQDRECLFCDVASGEMRLNEYGRIVRAVWDDLPQHYMNTVLDAFVVMPNHVHGILILVAGAGLKPAPTRKTHGLPEIIRGFKTFSARRINQQRNTLAAPLWQRNYFEHIIRNEESLSRIRQYILDNPARWDIDRENPLATDPEPESSWLA